jgi:hypothetical protein
MQRERDVNELAGPSGATCREGRWPVFQVMRRYAVSEPAPGHQLRETLIVDLGDWKRRHLAAVPQHRYSLCELDDFLQPMTNENDRHTKFLETPDYREQQFDFMTGQGRSRLVREQQTRVTRQATANRHDLSLGDGQLNDWAGRDGSIEGERSGVCPRDSRDASFPGGLKAYLILRKK